MSSVDTGESDLRERLTAIVCVTPPLMRVLSVHAAFAFLIGLCLRARSTNRY